MGHVSEAVGTGHRVQILTSLRAYLAALVDGYAGSPAGIAPITKQLADVTRELDGLAPPTRERTPLDELASRRSAAAGSRRP